MIILTSEQWENLKKRLSQEHPLSVMAMRYKMREVLGFTVREHKQWVPKHIDKTTGKQYGQYDTQICLDFYDDAKETWFHLKYMNL